jgi:hypothetical protein
MKLLNIDLVRADDWEGIYVLGKLWEQDHSINWFELLKKHVVHISTIRWADEEWLATVGSYPATLSEVKFNDYSER